MNYTGNNMIDGDMGDHYFSPKFKDNSEAEMVHCSECGDLYPEEDLIPSNILGSDICQECFKKQIELANQEGEIFN